MMSRIVKKLCIVFFLPLGAVAIYAQTSGGDEYDKNEYYIGYSQQRVEGGEGGRNGFEVAYVRNVHRYLGVKADFSAVFKSNRYSVTATDVANGTYTYTGEGKSSLYNVLAGVQLKDNASNSRFKPFAHALVGAGHNRFAVRNLGCVAGNCPPAIIASGNTTFSDTGFAGAFGGGLDIKVNDHVDIRAIQVDYNPIYSNSQVNNNVRFGIGLVFK